MMVYLRAHWLIVLCSLVLLLRIGDPHLHLCFDGQEPRASLHVLDMGGVEHPPGMSASHDDQNIDLSSEGLTKPQVPEVDFPPLLLGILATCILLLSRPRLPRSGRQAFGPVLSPVDLRPPLRGPPMTART